MDRLPVIRAEDFLPPEFLEKIKKEAGPIHARVFDYTKSAGDDIGYESAHFEIQSRGWPFMRWSLIFDRARPGHIEISELILENPIFDKASSKLRLSQEKKGLPISVFMFVREKIVEFLHAGGFKNILAVPENYTVSVLYRKFVQFSPANNRSLSRFHDVDKLFQYARSSLPLDVRVKSMDEFSKILGTGAERIPDALIEVEDLWRNRKNGKIPTGLEPFRDASGNLLGLIDRRNKNTKPAIYFFDNRKADGTFLRWSTLAEDREIDLRMKTDQ